MSDIVRDLLENPRHKTKRARKILRSCIEEKNKYKKKKIKDVYKDKEDK